MLLFLMLVVLHSSLPMCRWCPGTDFPWTLWPSSSRLWGKFWCPGVFTFSIIIVICLSYYVNALPVSIEVKLYYYISIRLPAFPGPVGCGVGCVVGCVSIPLKHSFGDLYPFCFTNHLALGVGNRTDRSVLLFFSISFAEFITISGYLSGFSVLQLYLCFPSPHWNFTHG